MWTLYFYSCTLTRWRSRFLFEKYLFLKNDLESPLIFVLFLKVNKIRKKTLSMTSYLEKWYVKNQIWARGLGYLSGRYDKDRNTPLSP